MDTPPITLTAKDIRNKARKFLMINRFSPVVLYSMILLVILAFAAFGIAVGFPFGFFVFIPLVMMYFFYAPIIYSSADFYQRSYNLKHEEYYAVFEGFKRENIFRAFILHVLLSAFGIGFLLAIMTGILVGVFVSPGIGVAVGFGAFIAISIPETYILLRSSMAFYFLQVDAQNSPLTAIQLSWAATKGNMLQLLRLTLSFFGWFLLAIPTASFALVYVIPYFQTAKSIFFRNVVLMLDDEEILDATKVGKIITPNSDANNESKLQLIQNNVQSQPSGAEGRVSPAIREVRVPPPVHSVLQDENNEAIFSNINSTVIPESFDFEAQAHSIQEMMKQPQEFVVPGFVIGDTQRELEIREDETFEEYRGRVQRLRALQEHEKELKDNQTDEQLTTAEKLTNAKKKKSHAYHSYDEDTLKAMEEQIQQNLEVLVTEGVIEHKEVDANISSLESKEQLSNEVDKNHPLLSRKLNQKDDAATAFLNDGNTVNIDAMNTTISDPFVQNALVDKNELIDEITFETDDKEPVVQIPQRRSQIQNAAKNGQVFASSAPSPKHTREEVLERLKKDRANRKR